MLFIHIHWRRSDLYDRKFCLFPEHNVNHRNSFVALDDRGLELKDDMVLYDRSSTKGATLDIAGFEIPSPSLCNSHSGVWQLRVLKLQYRFLHGSSSTTASLLYHVIIMIIVVSHSIVLRFASSSCIK